MLGIQAVLNSNLAILDKETATATMTVKEALCVDNDITLKIFWDLLDLKNTNNLKRKKF